MQRHVVRTVARMLSVPQKQMAWLLGGFLGRGAGLYGSEVPLSELLCEGSFATLPAWLLLVLGYMRSKSMCLGTLHRSYRRAYCLSLPSSELFLSFLSSCASVEILSHLEPFPVHPALCHWYLLHRNSKLYSKLSSSLQMTWRNDTHFSYCVIAQVVGCWIGCFSIDFETLGDNIK